MTLKQSISKWDAKATAPMEAAYRAHASSRAFTSRLITYSADPDLERAATWLIKHHMEAGADPPTPKAAQQLFANAINFKHWESTLHILQCMTWLPMPAASVSDIEDFLEASLDESNKFVRAWAYSAYATFAKAHPQYREEAEALLEDAMNHEEAPSIKARVRNILRAMK